MAAEYAEIAELRGSIGRAIDAPLKLELLNLI
jgi:hypothetical protein